MLPAWNVTLAEAAAGRSARIVTDVAVTAAKRATVRITDTLLRLRSLGNQTELEQPSRTCAQMGRVLDGTFEFIGDTINVLSAPEWSLEKLGWLQQRIEAAQRGQASPEQVVDEVAAEAPELRALIGNLSRAGWKAIQ